VKRVRHPRVIVSGGGTGGHIFPAISIANAIRRRWPESDILFVGAEDRMEMERVPAAGYPIEGLPVAGFDRKRPWKNVPVMVKLLRSLWESPGDRERLQAGRCGGGRRVRQWSHP